MMFRPLVFTVALAAVMTSAAAAAPDISGRWMLSTVTPTLDNAICIVKVETQDGKPSAKVEFSPPNIETRVVSLSVTDTAFTLKLEQSRTIQGRKLTNPIEFRGVRGKDSQVILGTISGRRAQLSATDKTELAANELMVNTAVEPWTKAMSLVQKSAQADLLARRERDAEKKKELQEKASVARKEMEEAVPGLYREVLAKHPKSPAALDSAMELIRAAKRLKMTPNEATELVKVVQKKSESYGPAFLIPTLSQASELLLPVPGLESAALAAIEPAAQALSDAESTENQSRVLAIYATALNKAGRLKEAKEISMRVNALEEKLDSEYEKAIPPFHPKAFAGRKDSSANRPVVLELFTGAQCPPCVAADVAFDALEKSYKPSELVLIEYHLHIPGPDALTNEASQARAEYYSVNSTPSTAFNGKLVGRGGGAMANSEAKYNEYTGIINPLLEQTTDVKLSGQATRKGDKVSIAVNVTGAEGEDLKLRLLVVEEKVKYLGSNQIRFHHQVVRAMPNGPAGVAIGNKDSKHSASVDLAQLRGELTHYLDDYAANTRPFARPDRPMEMKNLRVIALVQNDKTKEIVQALQLDVEGQRAAGSGDE